jgi:hypothetical protein
MQSWNGAKLEVYLCRLVFDSIVYNIWRNRKTISYINHPKTEEQLLKQIVWEVKIRILSKGKFKVIKGNVIICRI